MAAPSSMAATLPRVVCVLTGDRLFSCAHPHEVVECGLAYRVRGDMTDGLRRLAEEQYSLPADAEGWPLEAIDVVRWSGLRQIQLERSDFIRRWNRYVAALEQRLLQQRTEGGGEDGADAFLFGAHDLALRIMHKFDELDFLVGASEHAEGPLAILEYLDADPLTPTILFLCAGCREDAPPCMERAERERLGLAREAALDIGEGGRP